MATTAQITANQSNALKSSGPKSSNGKAIVSANATRHAILSDRLLVDGEKPSEFRALMQELSIALDPIGIVEAALVERIAISMWRQRRLVRAETAALALATQPKKIAEDISRELSLYSSAALSEDDLIPVDRDHAKWCEGVVDEFEQLDDFDVKTLKRSAPLIYAQLESDAESDNETIDEHLSAYNEGLSGYLGELVRWCQKEIETAQRRPKILRLADHFRSRNLILPGHLLHLFTRYQTMLDNQLYKALRALREAQEWRLKRVNPADEVECADVIENVA
jgi:hypothetical protein